MTHRRHDSHLERGQDNPEASLLLGGQGLCRTRASQTYCAEGCFQRSSVFPAKRLDLSHTRNSHGVAREQCLYTRLHCVREVVGAAAGIRAVRLKAEGMCPLYIRITLVQRYAHYGYTEGVSFLPHSLTHTHSFSLAPTGDAIESADSQAQTQWGSGRHAQVSIRDMTHT
jgi:hypothetical protein